MSRGYAGYLTLLAGGLGVVLFSLATLSLSLPDDDEGVSRASFVRRRVKSRWAHLQTRLHSLVSLRRELQQQQPPPAAAAAAALDNHSAVAANGTGGATHDSALAAPPAPPRR